MRAATILTQVKSWPRRGLAQAADRSPPSYFRFAQPSSTGFDHASARIEHASDNVVRLTIFVRRN